MSSIPPLVKDDLKYNWHPYTQMKDCLRYPPIVIERARGSKIYDNKGKYYYDTISSWWCNIHGHNHPRIKQAIKKQIDKLDHVLFAGFTHRPAVDLAKKLVDIAPTGLRRVFFSDNGSTAVETALKMSYQYWQNTGKKTKTKFVALSEAYHGDTLGAMSVSGVSLFNEVFKPLFFKAIKVPTPLTVYLNQKDKQNTYKEAISYLNQLFAKKHREIAAIIVEPLVLAAAGMIIYDKGFLKALSKLTKKYNIHFIADEVATGFGRTGKMFAVNHARVSPDFLCLSKGITSGTLPLGATLTTNRVYKAFYADYAKKKTFFHGHTFTANPIATAVSLAAIDIFKKEKTLDKVSKKAVLLKRRLQDLDQYPFLTNFRSIGLIGAMDIVKDKKKKIPYSAAKRIGMIFYEEGLKQNLILRPLGHVLYLYLPLSITLTEIEDIFNRMHKVFKRAETILPKK